MYIHHNNVNLMTASRQNCNAASLLLFLHRVVDVFKHYFEELEEESLRANFVVAYELLDEMMDFGYSQYTEAKILTEFSCQTYVAFNELFLLNLMLRII
ncbi:hypothetical protein QQ045_004723 [Rhodiola kirilowii]